MATHPEFNSPYFPRQVNAEMLEFKEWSNRVRQQMMVCLKKRLQSQSGSQEITTRDDLGR